jgi:hypothetical protein
MLLKVNHAVAQNIEHLLILVSNDKSLKGGLTYRTQIVYDRAQIVFKDGDAGVFNHLEGKT